MKAGNVTLVAHYGPKKQNLARFIRSLQNNVKQGLGREYSRVFTPYQVEQVHATLVGLEGKRLKRGWVNRNLYTALKRRRQMDFGGLLRFIQQTNILPMKIQFGRILPFREYGFKTFNGHPADWTFRIMDDRVIAIGWPIKMGSNRQDPLNQDLELFRRAVRSFGILHKYHKKPGDYDNDFFMVLGSIKTAGLSTEELSDYKGRAGIVEKNVQRDLLTQAPLRVMVGLEDISAVRYEDPRLPVRKTSVFPVSGLSASQIQNLFG